MMRNMFSVRAAALTAAGVLGAMTSAQAAPVPIQDPGFAVFLTGTTTPVPDNRSIDGGQGGQVNQPLRNAQTGVFDTGQFGDTPAGWAVFGGPTNRFRDDIEFSPSSGTMAGAVSSDPTVFAQTFSGTPVQPNTTYTATVEVIDRNSALIPPGGTDVTGIAATINLALLADFGGPGQTDLGGTTTFVPPPNGGRSVFTLMLTTGSSVPSGDLSIAVSSNGAGSNQFTQTFFDNVTLDASPVPEPATAGLLAAGTLLFAGRRRRSA